MKFLSQIETKYGIAYIVGKTVTGYIVSLPTKNMIVTHPNYRGGPCVIFEI